MRRLGLGLTAACVVAPLWLAVALAQEVSGRELVHRLGCLACHSFKGRGGTQAPAWDGLETRLSPEALQRQILTPKGRMPNYAHLRSAELAALLGYLSSLKDSGGD